MKTVTMMVAAAASIGVFAAIRLFLAKSNSPQTTADSPSDTPEPDTLPDGNKKQEKEELP